MTDRLYYRDCYLARFRARVVEASADGKRIYLDQTAFYPMSGGQPFDKGTLGAIAIDEVVDDDDRVAHLLSAPLPESAGSEVLGEIDWPRRFEHMQQHTGQHLLSAVFLEMLNAPTVSFHLGAESATIDLGCPALSPKQVQEVERRSNGVIFENRPVTIAFEEQSEGLGLRKRSEREGLLRIISIHDLDRSACGGTHVRATGEIGSILIRKLDRVRGSMRVEFVCGMRAVKQARADYEGLSKIARAFSAPLEETPGLVAVQLEKLQELEKVRRRLSGELAEARGKELYAQTAVDQDGVRKAMRRIPAISEDLRDEAQSFAAGEKAVLLVLAENPPSVLLAASKDSGWNAGAWLKDGLRETGGRGGGRAVLAQGSVPSKEALEELAKRFDTVSLDHPRLTQNHFT